MKFAFVVVSSICLCLIAERSVAADRPLPKDHPTAKAVDAREKVSRLTESMAKDVGGPGPLQRAAAVPRRNFIDEHIFGKMERDGITHAPLASDQEFFRRLHLDLTGRIAEPDQLRAFLASTDPGKRDKLVDSIIGSSAYKAKWTYWFGDFAMAAANRIGNDGKNLFYRYLYDNIHLDRPYDEMVRELITANAASNWYVGPANYVARWVVIGDNCADTVHEDTSDELAIHTAKHFLGINLQCISCHDGARHLEKMNAWLAGRKRAELFSMASFFGGTRVLRRVEVATTQDEYSIDDKGPGYDASARTVVRIPRRGKGAVEPSFMLTGEKPSTGKPLRAEYARMITSHPQFARHAVNLFWNELMGVGLVDTPFDFDLARLDPRNPPPAPWSLQPSHPDLLEALAKDFRENNHSLQRLFKLITKSSAYQLSSGFNGEWKGEYAKYYARKFVRRLTAEEMHDSLVQATGLYNPVPIRGTDVRARYATETRSPEDYKGKYPGLNDINFFLEAFGQTNREYAERVNEGDITQAVLLMNSPFVMKQVKSSPGSFLAQLLDRKPATADEDAIGEIFERFLLRKPTAGEAAMAKDLIQTRGRKGYEDLQWLLINKVEFIFNY